MFILKFYMLSSTNDQFYPCSVPVKAKTLIQATTRIATWIPRVLQRQSYWKPCVDPKLGRERLKRQHSKPVTKRSISWLYFSSRLLNYLLTSNGYMFCSWRIYVFNTKTKTSRCWTTSFPTKENNIREVVERLRIADEASENVFSLLLLVWLLLVQVCFLVGPLDACFLPFEWCYRSIWVNHQFSPKNCRLLPRKTRPIDIYAHSFYFPIARLW